MIWFGPSVVAAVSAGRFRGLRVRAGGRSALGALGVILGLGGALAAPAHSTEPPRWTWKLFSGGTPCPVGSSCASAGAFGTFFFEPVGVKSELRGGGRGLKGSPLSLQYEGGEAPLPYPEPLPLPKFTSLDRAVTTVTNWRPCDNGSCFLPQPPVGTRRWVAVVDWGNWHGWSVGWLISKYSAGNVAVVLYRLDHPDVVRFAGPQISDLHVVAALSRVADDLRLPGVQPPLAVNLSFGRRAGAKDPSVLGTCDASSLPCQISRLTGFLRASPGPGASAVEIIAAAGNFKSLLFPANDKTTTTAGSLDLARFAAKGAIQPTWETSGRPDVATVLLPTAGLALTEASETFYPPAGSSYAAALLTGWLGRPALGGPSPWLGSATAGGSLTLNPRLVPAFLPLYEPWPETAPDPPLAEVEATLGTTWSQALPISLSQMVATEHRPAPEPNPCVPCIDTRPPPDTDPPLHNTVSNTAGGLAGQRIDDLDLVIDLSASHPLPSGASLQEVLLRTDAGLRRLTLSPLALTALAEGSAGALRVIDGRAEVADGAFPSLVFLLAYSSGPFSGITHWVATPIVTRGDP